MPFLPLASLILTLLQVTACDQTNSKRSRIAKVGVTADENSDPAKANKKKITKDESTTTTASAVTFCDEKLSLAELKLDPQDENLNMDGVATSLCQLMKSSGKKVFLFQLVSTSCLDCATKVLRTESYISISSYLPHIEYVLLFTDKAPSEGEVTNFTINPLTVPAYDSKGVFGEEFPEKAQSNGSEFLIISTNGDIETHSGEKYLDAIGKAETLAKKVDQNLAATIPDLLKPTKIDWDGSTIKNNKRFSLSAME